MAFDKSIKNKKIFDYRERKQNLPMDQLELSTERIKVLIRLSSARNINTIKYNLEQILQDCECKVRGNVVTVSFYPPAGQDFDASNVLAIVQKDDPGAVEN